MCYMAIAMTIMIKYEKMVSNFHENHRTVHLWFSVITAMTPHPLNSFLCFFDLNMSEMYTCNNNNKIHRSKKEKIVILRKSLNETCKVWISLIIYSVVCFNILENEKCFLADRKLVNWQFHLHLGSVILKAFNLESVCLLGWLNFKREILPTKKQNVIFLFQMFSSALKTVYLNWFK